jgi:hypothetical protein
MLDSAAFSTFRRCEKDVPLDQDQHAVALFDRKGCERLTNVTWRATRWIPRYSTLAAVNPFLDRPLVAFSAWSSFGQWSDSGSI